MRIYFVPPTSQKFAHSPLPPGKIPLSRLSPSPTSYSLYTQNMLIRILFDVQFLQNVVFSFKKGSVKVLLLRLLAFKALHRNFEWEDKVLEELGKF